MDKLSEAAVRNLGKAESIALVLNDISFDPKGVAEAMVHEHKTLQQSFTSLCIEWLKVCASDSYAYDARNEASHITAKELLGGKEAGTLPLI